jgi:hypothetical protein
MDYSFKQVAQLNVSLAKQSQGFLILERLCQKTAIDLKVFSQQDNDHQFWHF